MIEQTPATKDEFDYEYFDRIARNPFSWFHSAEQLERASTILWNQIKSDHPWPWKKQKTANEDTSSKRPIPPITGAYLLLKGLAIENLLKGICIARNQDLVKNGRFTNDQLTTHNIVDIARMARVPIKGKSRLLREIWVCIEWASRYPVPKSFEDYDKRTKTFGGWKLGIKIKYTDSGEVDDSRGDVASLNKLYNELKHILEAEIQKPM